MTLNLMVIIAPVEALNGSMRTNGPETMKNISIYKSDLMQNISALDKYSIIGQKYVQPKLMCSLFVKII